MVVVKADGSKSGGEFVVTSKTHDGTQWTYQIKDNDTGTPHVGNVAERELEHAR